MVKAYSSAGINFKYPDNWNLEREETDSGWAVTVQSPGTAFWMLTLRADRPDVDALAECSLEAMRAEYPDLEVEECVESVAGQPAVGHDMRFFSLDLTNTCRTRSFYSSAGTVMIFWQLTDLEWERNEPVLRAISASLRVDQDE